MGKYIVSLGAWETEVEAENSISAICMAAREFNFTVEADVEEVEDAE